MSIPDSSSGKPRKLLIITCSGGAGLIQTANGKEQEARIKNPQGVIVRRDALKDWLWFGIGDGCVNLWNGSQTKGYVWFQSFCVWAQLLVDRFFWPMFFASSFYTFWKEDVDEIIDTQNMGTSAIINALRLYNRIKKKEIKLQKVLVDLPTNKATHFFWPIKSLSKKNRSLLKLITIEPLLEAGETREEFWQKNCRLSDKDIQYEDVAVRQSFKKYQGLGKASSDMKLNIQFKSHEELSLMQRGYQKGEIQAKLNSNELEFVIHPKDKVITVLLGSQPSSDATYNYMKKFIRIIQEENFTKQAIHLFLFCSEYKFHEMSLLARVVKFIDQMKDYPKHLSIIPFSFQTDETIAPLFYRSDITCTRSGGGTAMELMCVSNGEIWIHSEAKKTGETLLRGIPGWEAANALYLQKIRGAKIVSPETFAPHASRSLKGN